MNYLKDLQIVAALLIVGLVGLMSVEPSMVTAQATDDVTVTLNVTEEITITDGADSTMSPNLTASVNTSTGSSSWTVTTNSSDGYTLAVKASQSPALQNGNGDSFADYTEAVGGTPDSWSVDADSYEFGFSGYGGDVDASFGNGTNCGSSDPSSSDVSWLGFETSDQTLASASGPTSTSGTETTICFGAEQNGVFAPSGTYTATITATATAS